MLTCLFPFLRFTSGEQKFNEFFFFYHQVLRKILYLPKPPNEGKICVILDLMRMTKKQEIQLFNDRKIRTIWDDKEEKWYFSVVDVIEALTETDRPRKYWSDLKAKLKKEGSELSEKIGQL